MRTTHLLLIALGGALGTAVRWLVTDLGGETTTSIAILSLNVVGSAIVGFLAGSGRAEPNHGLHTVWPFAAIGFCGGLTTFSGYAVDIAARLDEGRLTSGAAVALTTIVLAVIAAGIGYRAGTTSGAAPMKRLFR